jgi:ADP-heptose:LPS heptosyltransferase
MGRLATRCTVLFQAFRSWPRPRRSWPTSPARILVAHQLLLGDVLMATAVLAKLRERFPAAAIVMTVKPAFLSLFAGRPYGVAAIAFDPSSTATVRATIRQQRAAGGFDAAIVLGDNRYSWLARALGARFVVAHAGDLPARKNWPIDLCVDYPLVPMAWGDMAAQLVPGPGPRRYTPSDWPPPPRPPGFAAPEGPYAVLHVGASTPLKQWSPDRWVAIARALAIRGVTPVWSAGRGEESLIKSIDPAATYRSYAGQLDLSGLWHLLAGARLVIAPDTGVAHLARLVGTPTVALFGPGSPTVSGGGEFFSLASFRAVTVANIACRDQPVLFRRPVAWVRRCGRAYGTGRNQCAQPICMAAIEVTPVLAATDHALADTPRS